VILELPGTTTSAINRRLVELRSTGGAVALGRVMTLVVIVDDRRAEGAIAAAIEASREHPCRVLVVVQGESAGAARLDAQLRVGGDAGAGEVVVLRLSGGLTVEGASVVVPLLLPDAPIVTWWPATSPLVPAEDPIGALAQRRITDAAESADPVRELDVRALGYQAGDTDFAWTRLTRWRALLAAALDLPPDEPVTAVRVAGAANSPSTTLMADWLAVRLRCPVERTVAGDAGMRSVELDRPGGTIALCRQDGGTTAVLSQPGEPDHTLSLPRRSVATCLAEELRRLDPDEVYGDVIAQHGSRRGTSRVRP
jgi:glucose-6-phosphate dehydrogenase assembly protein OpcA